MQRSLKIIAVLCFVVLWGIGSAPAPLLAQAPPACTELVMNGGFETVGSWQLGASPAPPQYTSSNVHSGNWSLLLGIADGINRKSFSSARQTVAIPAAAQSAVLSFWVFTVATGAPTTDTMELALLSPDGATILAKPWISHSDNRAWSQLVFDLTAWRGRTFQLYFNVYNDGLGGMAQMFVDDVSLVTCPGGGGGLVTPAPGTPGLVTPIFPTVAPGATATRGACPNPILPCKATPAATGAAPPAAATAAPQAELAAPVIIQPQLLPDSAQPSTEAAAPAIIEAAPVQEPPAIIVVEPTGADPAVSQPAILEPTPATGEVVPAPAESLPAPAYWADPILNGGFEEGLTYWDTEGSGDAPLIVDTETHRGLRALRLGAAEAASEGASIVTQEIVVPAGFSDVALDFWVYPWSGENAGDDYQEVGLLDPGGASRTLLWRDLNDAREWTRQTIPITSLGGQPVRLQFSVYNDGEGGSTGMLVDDVSLVTLGPETQIQEAGSADGRGGIVEPVEPSVTRIALVVTALPPAPALVQATVVPDAELGAPMPTSTPASTAGSRRRITDQWPKYWWLIPIGFAAIFVLIWLFARRPR